MGVSYARLPALPAFLASTVGAKNALSEIFGLEHVDETYDDSLKQLRHSARLAQRDLPAGQKKTTKGLSNEKVLRRRVGIFWNFYFKNFDRRVSISQKYKKDGHFDEKERKNRTTTNIVRNGRAGTREKRSLLSWQ